MTFGEWLKRAHPRHPFEHDFRIDALFYEQEGESFAEEDFSDVRDLISNMEHATGRGNRPCAEAVEGAVRCWVRWRQSEERRASVPREE